VLTILGDPYFPNQNKLFLLKRYMCGINDLSKIVSVVTDNAANILKAIQDILKLKHVPCFAHTMSLAVKSAIHDDPQCSALLELCRNIVTYFHSSSHATSKLNMCCNGKKRSRLVQECPTRWNATFLMIESL
jgi:hypothetical protein